MKKTYKKPTTLSLLMQTDGMLLAASTTSGSTTTSSFGVTGTGAGLLNGNLTGAGTGGTLTGGKLNEAW